MGTADHGQASPQAQLRLVGTFGVHHGGAPVTVPDLGSRKARALLKLLAVERAHTVPSTGSSSRRSGYRAHAGWHVTVLGAVARLQGHYDEAIGIGRRAVALSEAAPHVWTAAAAGAALGVTLLEAGRVDEALAVLEHARIAASRTVRRPSCCAAWRRSPRRPAHPRSWRKPPRCSAGSARPQAQRS